MEGTSCALQQTKKSLRNEMGDRMLSIIALIFTVPAAIFLWIPFLAGENGVYDGGQALA